jgi:hypothetical protein
LARRRIVGESMALRVHPPPSMAGVTPLLSGCASKIR